MFWLVVGVFMGGVVVGAIVVTLLDQRHYEEE